MPRSVCLHPFYNCIILVQPVGDFLKGVAVNFQERQKVLVEPDSLIVVTVEQSFAMKPGFVDQARQMHVAAKFLVRTAWMQSLHGADRTKSRAPAAGRPLENHSPERARLQVSVPATILPV